VNSSDERSTVILHFDVESGVWCVTSPTVPELFAGGDSLEEARENARRVVAEAVDPSASIVEWLPEPESTRSILSRAYSSNRAAISSLVTFDWGHGVVEATSGSKTHQSPT